MYESYKCDCSLYNTQYMNSWWISKKFESMNNTQWTTYKRPNHLKTDVYNASCFKYFFFHLLTNMCTTPSTQAAATNNGHSYVFGCGLSLQIWLQMGKELLFHSQTRKCVQFCWLSKEKYNGFLFQIRFLHFPLSYTWNALLLL